MKDLSDMHFGRLHVTSRSTNSISGKARWNCECLCGNKVIVDGYSLRSGNTSSCGCIIKERFVKNNTTHGKSKTKIYRTYLHMMERCYSKNDKRYSEYGGRGIKICDEWLSDFMNFYNWSVENGYSDYLSIDRIEVNGNYEPSNCRWATAKIQQNNRRNNHYITLDGITKTLSQWSDVSGIKSFTILRRLNIGWSAKRAIFEKVRGGMQ